MTKLRLKRTPEEEQQRARRRAYKAAKKAAKRKRSDLDDPADTSSRKRQHSDDEPHKPDDDAEMRFREKMWDALEDDERLDGINARFDDYAHIPDRWLRDEHDLANPQYMDDDEYAEWVREGMWKKKHAREYEEQAKRDAEKAAKRAQESAIKAETSRLHRLALEREERRRKKRQRDQEEEYRQQYEQRWKALLDPQTRDPGSLSFCDIPWPIFLFQFVDRNVSDSAPLQIQDITPEAVAAFLLPCVNDMSNRDTLRQNRDKLKETLLRFHPDKFEGRVMHRVVTSDIEVVREAVGQVTRVLNVLMSEKS